MPILKYGRFQLYSLDSTKNWTPNFLAITMMALLSGCLLLNDVNPVSTEGRYISDKAMPQPGRAIVIFGLGIEEQIHSHYDWFDSFFGISLDEYSIERQDITGNCWRYNKMVARVPGIVGTRQYFAFDVQPGHYVAHGRLIDMDEHIDTEFKHLAFEVPADRIVYLGDFIWTKDNTQIIPPNNLPKSEGKVELRRNSNAMKAYFKKDVLLASTQLVPRATGVLCMP